MAKNRESTLKRLLSRKRGTTAKEAAELIGVTPRTASTLLQERCMATWPDPPDGKRRGKPSTIYQGYNG